ncbi:MAG: biotin synthase [Burkholderiaceae bacterium]
MPEPPVFDATRDVIDARAVDHLLRRLARLAEAPWLHLEVARRMAERLPLIRQPPRHWIDWWAHLGGGAAAVRQAYPQAQRVAVEPNAALRARSLERSGPWWSPRRWSNPVPQVLLPAEVAEASTEMVWANMMLHACVDIADVFAQWRRALVVDGFVMFSTLGPATLQELRALYGEAGFGPPHAPFADMHDIGDLLVRAGFADPVMDQEPLTLTWSSPQAALQELRSLGGNLHPGRMPGLRTPRWHARLLRALERRADAEGRIAMSFELVYGHAVRPRPRARVAATSTVSLADMRASLSSGRPAS